ncbi:LAG1 homologue 2 [Actinidia rufa]|uniref:LAG1 homologue 2 n=1 Tax=Actinidia rufa TaxID=165716 RepID=A0A7J0EUW2_9ERIC|nr:LAG1 homologue 2 [Actinidia rufa]
MDSIWSDNGAPSAWHFACAVYFAFGFVAARFLLDRFIFRRLAIWLLSNGALPLKMNETTRAKIVKCSESLWKLTYYATVEVCVAAITYHEPWFRDVKGYFRGWPSQELKIPLKLFLYVSVWILHLQHCCPPFMGNSKERFFCDDVSHHVVTVILIGYSYITSFFRIGSIVLALHDASDVFMEAAKVFKYAEKEIGASVCFGLFAISWLLLLRLIFFPFRVIKASSYDSVEFLDLSEAYPTLIYYVFNTMLITLLVFHIYWWLLICSMIRRQLKNRGKVGEDIRSDSEDDE